MSAEVSAWVSAVAAALSVAFAVFAWWYSHASAKAKEQASQERRRAEEHERLARQSARRADEQLAEVRRQAEALEALVRRASPPVLVARPVAEHRWALVNTTDEQVAVEEVANADEWLLLAVDGEVDPFIVEPHGTVEVNAHTAMGKPGAHHLELRLGDGELLRVELPSCW